MVHESKMNQQQAVSTINLHQNNTLFGYYSVLKPIFSSSWDGLLMQSMAQEITQRS